MRILIAEDDAALAGFVRKGLEAEFSAVMFLPTASRRVRFP
jgi:DNA-binding response OmpR family regulator